MLTASQTTSELIPPTFGRPELLAPAGDWVCAKAAVENGADAIYFGLERFNARMRADNFAEAELPELMEFLHLRGVKGYVTLNTLIFPQELTEAQQYIRTIIAAGVDAAIVQDIGICRLIRHLSPDFPIHASTQMTITSAAGIEFAKELGCQLVVLARECSLPEIEKIQHQIAEKNTSLPLEVFVHGALCVAYSGQCLTSEALGGRSANRGECAQACRMTYELVVDGETVNLGDRKYLLSPQDLAGLEVLPELVKAGVSSLKIEGRLKTAEYVANVTRVYREAIDRILISEYQITDEECYNLEMAFSRGLYTGWFRGINNQELVHARFGKKRGVYLGEVTRIGDGQVYLKLQAPIKPGDGIVFDRGRPETQEEGGRVYAVKPQGKETALTFGRQDLNLNLIDIGDKVWKTSDPELDKKLRQTFDKETPQFQRAIEIEIYGEVGEELIAIARDEQGNIVQVKSAILLAEAQKQPLTNQKLEEQFGRLGNTPFRLETLKNNLSGKVMLPVSELNRIRREIVAELEDLRKQPKRWELRSNASVADLLPANSTSPPTPLLRGEGSKIFLTSSPSAISPSAISPSAISPSAISPSAISPSAISSSAISSSAISSSAISSSAISSSITPPLLSPPFPGREGGLGGLGSPELIVLVRSLKQLESAIKAGISPIYCELEDVRKYREAVRLVRQNRVIPDQSIWVAPPRITKPGETWILQQVLSSEADGYLLRNYDQLQFFAGKRCVGDFSFNVANALTADYFKNKLGLERLTASYDLNINQLSDLLVSCPPDWLEVTIHQHIPMFHMEHCVFCAFLSDGTDYTNCGRPCEDREVKLRDRVGMKHILQADAGCRNTVFNGTAQTGAEYVQRLIELGLRKFRIEFVNETPPEVTKTIDRYRKLLQGEISGSQLWRELRLQNQLGVTRGPLGLSAKL